MMMTWSSQTAVTCLGAQGQSLSPAELPLPRARRFETIVANGQISINSGDAVAITGPYTDADGKRVIIQGLPSSHAAVCGAWPQSQGLTNRSGIVTGEVDGDSGTTVVLTLATDTPFYLVADAVSYFRSAEISFDTAIHDDVDVSLRRIVDAAGNDLIPDMLTTAEQSQYDLIDYDVAADEIIFGGTSSVQTFSYNAVARAIEVGQSGQEAQENPYVCIIETGSFKFDSGANRTIKRKSGLATSIVPDLSGFQFTQIGSTDAKDFVDFANGAILVNTGNPAVVSLSGVAESDFHGYLDSAEASILNKYKLTQAEFDTRMLAVPDTTKDDYHGSGGGGGSLDQTTFDERMLAVPDTTKAGYKGTGSGSLDQSTFDTRMAAVPSATKDAYKGTAGGGIDQSTFDTRMAAVPSTTERWLQGRRLVDPNEQRSSTVRLRCEDGGGA